MSHSAPLSLRPGERLVYRLGWGLLSGAGRMSLETHRASEADALWQVRLHAETVGMAAALHPFAHVSTSFIDAVTSRLQRIETTSRNGSAPTSSTTTTLDFARGRMQHTDATRAGRSRTADLAATAVFDPATTLLHARTWAMRPGESRRVTIMHDGELHEVAVAVVRDDAVQTARGRTPALEVEVSPAASTPTRLRRDLAMSFWLSREEHPQLIRMKLKSAGVGTIVAVLTSVETVAAVAHENPHSKSVSKK